MVQNITLMFRSKTPFKLNELQLINMIEKKYNIGKVASIIFSNNVKDKNNIYCGNIQGSAPTTIYSVGGGGGGRGSSVGGSGGTRPNTPTFDALVHFKYWYNNEFTQFLQNELVKYTEYYLAYFFEDRFIPMNGDYNTDYIYILCGDISHIYCDDHLNKGGYKQNIEQGERMQIAPPLTTYRNGGDNYNKQFENKHTEHKHAEYLEKKEYIKEMAELKGIIEKQQKMMNLLQDEINGMRVLLLSNGGGGIGGASGASNL